ncbi:MAG: hypothetical protein J5965_09315 [Aeriscardovia sp.]|nr:hypothetical protein [Aeriscardovia sp.]
MESNVVILSLDKYEEIRAKESTLLNHHQELYERVNYLSDQVRMLEAKDKLSKYAISLLYVNKGIDKPDTQDFALVTAISLIARDQHCDVSKSDILDMYNLHERSDYKRLKKVITSIAEKYPDTFKDIDYIWGWLKENTNSDFLIDFS